MEVDGAVDASVLHVPLDTTWDVLVLGHLPKEEAKHVVVIFLLVVRGVVRCYLAHVWEEPENFPCGGNVSHRPFEETKGENEWLERVFADCVDECFVCSKQYGIEDVLVSVPTQPVVGFLVNTARVNVVEFGGCETGSFAEW